MVRTPLEIALRRAVGQVGLEWLNELLASGEFWQCRSCSLAYRTTRWPKPASGHCHTCSGGAGAQI